MSQSHPIIYVTRDIERALGIAPSADYRIITNRTPYAESIAKDYPAYITLIDTTHHALLDTAELLEHEIAIETITQTKGDILVFKNTSRIESITKHHSWKLLNPSAVLAEKVENKITQIDWLGKIGDDWLPLHHILHAKEILWKNGPLIIQWAHGHTGDSTLLVNTASELEAIQKIFPERLARVSAYIHGPSFTMNVVVSPDKTIIGNPSYQITGIPPFTEGAFTTIGNDWSLPYSLLDESELSTLNDLAILIGEKLRTEGWKGLYGIDVIKDEERGRFFLIEINARQPASTTYESLLQKRFRDQGITGITLFETHLLALRGESIHESLVPVNDGSQIIQRITSRTKHVSPTAIKVLEERGYTVISYSNTNENADLIRIQSIRDIMETHGKFNARGKEIVEIMSA